MDRIHARQRTRHRLGPVHADDHVRVLAHHVVDAFDVVRELDRERGGARLTHGGERVERELERGRELEQRCDLGVEDHGVHVDS